MKNYGQFCSMARALDLLGERWTLLLVRELLCGATTFGDLQRGVPRISRTMLSARLRELVEAGVVAHQGQAYALTAAGRELESVVAALGVWGQRWLPRTLREDESDVDTLLWDMRRRVEVARLPRHPTVVRIDATRARPRWLLLRASEVSLCSSNPGFKEALVLRGDRRALVAWWRGDIEWPEARRRGLHLEGAAALVRAFPGWFQRYLFAEVAAAG